MSSSGCECHCSSPAAQEREREWMTLQCKMFSGSSVSDYNLSRILGLLCTTLDSYLDFPRKTSSNHNTRELKQISWPSTCLKIYQNAVREDKTFSWKRGEKKIMLFFFFFNTLMRLLRSQNSRQLQLFTNLDWLKSISSITQPVSTSPLGEDHKIQWSTLTSIENISLL